MYFNNCRTLEDVKREYHRLSKIHHPDIGGDTTIMAEINREYTAWTISRNKTTSQYSSYSNQQQAQHSTQKKRSRKTTIYSESWINSFCEILGGNGGFKDFVDDKNKILLHSLKGYKFVLFTFHFVKNGKRFYTCRKYNTVPKKYSAYCYC